MFKNITAFEVAFVFKLDMDRGMDGDKFLELPVSRTLAISFSRRRNDGA